VSIHQFVFLIKKIKIFLKKKVVLYEKKLKIPKFRNEDEERKFWDKIDLGDYL
jgi:hypothetical protein